MPLYNPGILATGGTVTGNVAVTGNETVSGTATISGTAAAAANLIVGGTTALGDDGAGEIQFSTVTTEPTTNPTGGVVMYANSAGHLKWRDKDGTNPVLAGSLGSQTSTVTIASSNTLTLLQTQTIKANDLIAGSSYRMTGYGVYSVTGTPTLTFALYWGGVAGTAIAAVPAITAGSGVTNVPFSYVATVTARSTTTVTAAIVLFFGTSASTDAASLFVATPTAVTTVVSNADKDLTMGFTWSASDPANTISLLGGGVELVR